MNAKTLRASLLAVTTAIALCAAIVPLAAHAYDENSTAAINVDAKGVGLKGHDPVAYFTAGAPTAGKAEFNAAHAGVTFQYGGFCAMGVALERKLDGDPNAWRVVDGKLYLNVNKDVQKKWLEDVPGNNKKADVNWPQIKGKTPKSLA